MKHYNTREEANQANAQLSTGPQTEEGKRIASHNAVKTGLTGRTILLPSDDAAAFEALMARVAARYLPATDEERELAEAIGHLEWRLARIPALLASTLAVGRELYADHFPDKPLSVRRDMIDAEVHIAYAKPLSNLALQEARLTRQHDKQTAKLQTLLDQRKKERATLLNQLYNVYKDKLIEDKPFVLPVFQSFGFEFSYEDLKQVFFEREAPNLYPSAPIIAARQLFLTQELANVLFEEPDEELEAETEIEFKQEPEQPEAPARPYTFDIRKHADQFFDQMEAEGTLDPECDDRAVFLRLLQSSDKAKKQLPPSLIGKRRS